VEKTNDDLYALYSSPNIIRVMKSRMMRWAVHVAHMGERRNAYRVLVGKPERRRRLRRPDMDGRTILKWIFEKLGWGMDWIDLAQDRNVAAPCECGNELPGFIKLENFLTS
jgi:hypothetical protein